MKLLSLHAGLTILLLNAKDKVKASLGGADHDVVYVIHYSELNELHEDDIAALKNFGFRQGEEGWEFFT